MRSIRWWWLLSVCLWALTRSATAEPALPPSAPGVGVDQHIGAVIPKDIALRDVDGRALTTGDLFSGERPMVLVLAYSSCPMLCNLVLRGVAEAAHDARLRPGQDFDVVTVSIDPSESTDIARQTEQRLSDVASKSKETVHWRYLMSDEPNIHRLADALGFRYRLDTTTHQYAHPAVVFILSPRGAITQYLLGLRQPAGALDSAIEDARNERLAQPSAIEAALSCFRFDPTRRKYGSVISLGLRLGAVMVLFGAAALGLWLFRHRRAT